MKLEFLKIKKNKESTIKREERKLPEIERVERSLNSIDFDVLKQCFSNMYKKFGLDPNNMNFVDKNKIKIHKYIFGKDFDAVFSHKKNLKESKYSQYIAINSDIYFNYPERYMDDVVLDTVIHEEVHSTNSKELNICIGDKKTSYLTSGVAHDINNDKVYRLFNEGLTEKIKDIILTDYNNVKGKGIPKYFSSYEEGRFLVDLFVYLVNKDTMIDADTILQSLIKSSYENNLPDHNSGIYSDRINNLFINIKVPEYKNILKCLVEDVTRYIKDKRRSILGVSTQDELIKKLEINPEDLNSFIENNRNVLKLDSLKEDTDFNKNYIV